jgi:hypothetical protein
MSPLDKIVRTVAVAFATSAVAHGGAERRGLSPQSQDG